MHRTQNRWLHVFVAAILLPTAAEAAGSDPGLCSDCGLARCSDLRDVEGDRLRDLVHSSSSTLPFNYMLSGNNEIRYLVIAPDLQIESARNAIVFFNGTGTIISDWPFDMLKGNHGHLCAEHTLIFFDYPGVGRTDEVSDEDFTLDNLARDVDTLVSYVNDTHGEAIGPNIDIVHPLGWSLGSLAASKFAGLARANGYHGLGDRRIGNLFLISTKPGGDTASHPAEQGVTGNQSQCMEQLLGKMEDEAFYTEEIKKTAFQLTFPYVYANTAPVEIQAPYDGADNKVCVAEIEPNSVTLTDEVNGDRPIETSCATPPSPLDRCELSSADYALNRLKEPYLLDDGINYHVYRQQRVIVRDADFSYCLKAKENWTHDESACNKNPHQWFSPWINLGKAGVCETEGEIPNQPRIVRCMPLDHITGELIVMNGDRDLYLQWIYGEKIVEAYQTQPHQPGAAARYEKYPGAAGHGVLLTAPDWVGGILVEAMNSYVPPPIP